MLRWIKSEIPEGTSGNWKVEKFTVDKNEAKVHNLRCAINAHSAGREIEEGVYTQLKRNGEIVMSDTPAELKDFKWFISMAEGHVLVSGLGLVTQALIYKDSVKSVTIIEISPDVTKLVAPHFSTNKLCIIEGNAKNVLLKDRIKSLEIDRFDFAWHDIWDNICSDNLEEMKQLRKRFCRIVRSNRQYCWCETVLKRMKTSNNQE